MFIKNRELIEYINYMKYFGKHFDNHHLTIYSLSVIVYIYFLIIIIKTMISFSITIFIENIIDHFRLVLKIQKIPYKFHRNFYNSIELPNGVSQFRQTDIY